MQIRAWIIGGFLVATGAFPAAAQTPLSAIDWLNDTAALPDNLNLIPFDEVAVSDGVETETITVTSLDAITSDATGLLPTSVTGLPPDLWGTTASTELADLFLGLPDDLLPALKNFTRTLLLAELNPPADSDPEGALFLARIDALTRFGAVNEAQALLERAGTETTERFFRWFDLSLLTNTADRACTHLRANPALDSALDKRIFCHARGGDWSAAAVTLETARVLGELDAAKLALLTRFLADDLEEPGARLPKPRIPTPLEFRLHEAIGEPLATTDLPLAYAHADLNANVGWKTRIEAAERLSREGAISENMLLGLYTERLPAASGGVWDRVAAMQKLDEALTTGDSTAVSDALPNAWLQMAAADLGPAFAALNAERIALHQLAGSAKSLAFRISLLAADYESTAVKHEPGDPEERFLKAVARGDVTGVVPPDEFARAVADGFNAASISETLSRMTDNGNLGAALLTATDLMSRGVAGDLDKLSQSIAFFRAVGLEGLARRAALQALILGPRA